MQRKYNNVILYLMTSLMIDGQFDLAIQNYAKSLELNPNNANAIIMLQRIHEQR